MNYQAIAVSIIALVGTFLSGSALTAFLNNRARRNVIGAEAAQGDAAALTELLQGAGGFVIQQMRDTMARQDKRIVELEGRLEARDGQIEEMQAREVALQEENRELRRQVQDLERRLSALESQ